MIPQNEPRMVLIRLRDVCFLSELAFLLGVSDGHVKKLTSPPKAPSGAWYRDQKFPEPFTRSPGGIRIWWVRDVEAWARQLRSKRTGARKGKGIPLLDCPELVDELLGL